MELPWGRKKVGVYDGVYDDEKIYRDGSVVVLGGFAGSGG